MDIPNFSTGFIGTQQLAPTDAYQQGMAGTLKNQHQQIQNDTDAQTLASTKLDAIQGVLGGVKDEASFQAGKQLLLDHNLASAQDLAKYGSYGDGSQIAALNNTIQAHKANAAVQVTQADAMAKGSAQVAQQLAAAAASGNQDIYTKTKAKLQSAGMDTSNFADDYITGGKQANALANYQQPLGQLLNATTKMDANAGTQANAGGNLYTPNAITNSVLGNRLGGVAPPQAAPQPAPQASTNVPVPSPYQQGLGAPPVNDTQPTPEVAPPQNTPQQAPANNTPPPIGTFGNLKVYKSTSGNPVAVTSMGTPQFVPPAPDPTKTQAANQQAFEQALKTYQSDPQVLAANKAAEANATKMGDAVGDTSKTFNIMMSNLPLAMQRFENMRQLSANASYGAGVDKNGGGLYPWLQNTMFGSADTNKANGLLHQAASQAILPEIAPQLVGLRPNKFLEGYATGSSGLDESAPPETKIALIDGLQNNFITNLKSNATQLRNNGQPAPTDAEIDDYVATLAKQGTTNPAAQSWPPTKKQVKESVTEIPSSSVPKNVANQLTGDLVPDVPQGWTIKERK